MSELLGGSPTIITSVSADIFDAKTDVAHHNEKDSDNDGKNYGSSMVTLKPPHAGKSKVATNTPKTSALFTQSEYIKVGYFGKFEFVYIQRDHRETFYDEPMIFFVNPNNQNKTTAGKELYAFYELCMFDVFILIIRTFYVGTDNVDYSRSTQEVYQAIKNRKKKWKIVNGKTFTLTPDIFFDKYLALSGCLPDNISLWTITI